MRGLMPISWFLALASIAHAATPLGTGFTYQGQVRQSGVPLNGTADFSFSLWDDAGNGNPPTGGTQIGAAQALNSVTVANGLFSVQLNAGGEFGPAAFNGDARWLQIAVRSPAGSGSFTTLVPRQPITAAPYALHALNAGAGDGHSLGAADGNPVDALFVDNAGNVGIGTTSPGRLLDVNGSVTVHGSMFFNTPGVLEIAHENNTGMRIDPASNSVQLETDGSIGLTLTSSRNVGIGTNSPLFPLHVETNSTSGRGVFGLASAATGDTYGGYFQSQSTTGLGVLGWATAASGGAYGVKGQSDSTSGRGVFGLASAGTGTTNGGYFESVSTSGRAVYSVASAASGITYGVYGKSDSPSGRGVYGHAIATSGDARGVFGVSSSTAGLGTVGYATATTGMTYGVYGQSDSTSGRGVYGLASPASGTTYGGNFQSQSTSGIGALGYATATSGPTYGLWGQSDSAAGYGVFGKVNATSGTNYGGYFTSNSTSGHGVYGVASATTGTTYGLYGRSNSTSGTGVFGNTSAGTGTTYGVQGESASTDGRGVYGYASAASGYTRGVLGMNASTSGAGVFGYTFAASGTNYGVAGKSDSTSGYGVYSFGDMGASGTKPFRIDHPDDPENKYLLHYSAESPEVINFYRGTVTLDGAGEAVVELPHYFAKINKSPSYQLTAVGAPMPMLHVAEEIDETALKAGEQARSGVAPSTCSFRIAGGAAGGKVSWRVEALRNDLRMRLHGAPVERDKTGPERGKYQHPEHYGQPPEKGMDYHEDRGALPIAGPDGAQR